MRRVPGVVVVGVFLLAGCGGDEPAAIPDVAPVEESDESVESEASDPDDADVEEEPVEPDESDPDAESSDASLQPPAEVSEPVGVVYEASGSLNETFTLIQTPDVSVFSTDEVAMYVDEDTLIVCSTGEGCIRSPREGIEAMGMLGGQIISDMSAFAASVPFASSSTETIAGRDARCIVPEDDEDLKVYCYDLVSGIALRWEVIDEGGLTKLTAVEVFEPTQDDLTPSGPVQDLPSGPDLGGMDLGDLDIDGLPDY